MACISDELARLRLRRLLPRRDEEDFVRGFATGFDNEVDILVGVGKLRSSQLHHETARAFK